MVKISGTVGSIKEIVGDRVYVTIKHAFENRVIFMQCVAGENAAEHIRTEICPGDLVLLRGNIGNWGRSKDVFKTMIINIASIEKIVKGTTQKDDVW